MSKFGIAAAEPHDEQAHTGRFTAEQQKTDTKKQNALKNRKKKSENAEKDKDPPQRKNDVMTNSATHEAAVSRC